MFDPYAHVQRINCGMVYLCACLVAGIRLERKRQVNVRVVTLYWVAELSVFSRSIPSPCSAA